MAEVIQARKNVPPAGFGTALRILRKVAHENGLVVGGPCRLIGAERTGYGDSDEMEEGPASYRLINEELLFDGVFFKKLDKALLTSVADKLLPMGDVDIAESFAPPSARLPEFENERGRWMLKNSKGHPVGLVVRTGDGSSKRYMLHLYDGLWYLNSGPPPFDLPMFGLDEVLRNPGKPVMIHEGPKAWQGAMAAADARTGCGRLANWMSLYTHVAWHGSDAGIHWTDWSPLKGRRVLIWPDMDEAGISNAIALARRIARMGEIVGYVNWGADDMVRHEGWDWADPMNGYVGGLTRFDIRSQTKYVESPFLMNGEISEPWARRSFLDAEKQEIYQQSNGYRPRLLSTFGAEYGKGATTKIVSSLIRPFIGRTFSPGRKMGLLPDGRINMCPENPREPITPAPLDSGIIRELTRGWLARMIPDVRQRKHFIRKAAWAIIRPEKISQHMIVMQGMSGIGKSVIMDLVCSVAGDDRAGAVYPDSIFKSFNDAIKDKSIVCIHEIHSDDISRKQNASRLKELVGNSHITVREKYRSDELRENVIHWFGATNERIPFAMENGNDRFYFVRCAGPVNERQRAKMRRFFSKWLPLFRDQVFLDTLYAAAKFLVLRLNSEQVRIILGRARRQRVWGAIEQASLRPWEQSLLEELNAIYEQDVREDEDHPPVFYAEEIVRIIKKEYGRIGPMDIRAKMVEFGYRTLRDRSGVPVQRRVGGGQRVAMWCREADLTAIQNRENYGSLRVRSAFQSQPGGG